MQSTFRQRIQQVQSQQGTNGVGVFKEYREKRGGVSTGSSRAHRRDESGQEAEPPCPLSLS